MFNPNPAGFQTVGQQLPNGGTQPDQGPKSDEFVCPECGAVLQDMEHRRKHSIGHWGDLPIPVNHLTLTARKRQAALVGKQEPGE